METLARWSDIRLTGLRPVTLRRAKRGGECQILNCKRFHALCSSAISAW